MSQYSPVSNIKLFTVWYGPNPKKVIILEDLVGKERDELLQLI